MFSPLKSTNYNKRIYYTSDDNIKKEKNVFVYNLNYQNQLQKYELSYIP